jgi:hypothetical protein
MTDLIHSIGRIRNKFVFKTNSSPIVLFFRILFAVIFVDLLLIIILSIVNFIDK